MCSGTLFCGLLGSPCVLKLCSDGYEGVHVFCNSVLQALGQSMFSMTLFCKPWGSRCFPWLCSASPVAVHVFHDSVLLALRQSMFSMTLFCKPWGSPCFPWLCSTSPVAVHVFYDSVLLVLWPSIASRTGSLFELFSAGVQDCRLSAVVPAAMLNFLFFILDESYHSFSSWPDNCKKSKNVIIILGEKSCNKMCL